MGKFYDEFMMKFTLKIHGENHGEVYVKIRVENEFSENSWNLNWRHALNWYLASCCQCYVYLF